MTNAQQVQQVLSQIGFKIDTAAVQKASQQIGKLGNQFASTAGAITATIGFKSESVPSNPNNTPELQAALLVEKEKSNLHIACEYLVESMLSGDEAAISDSYDWVLQRAELLSFAIDFEASLTANLAA